MKATQAYLYVYVFTTVTLSLTVFQGDFISNGVSITSLLKRPFLLLPSQNLKYFMKFERSFSQAVFEFTLILFHSTQLNLSLLYQIQNDGQIQIKYKQNPIDFI